MSEQTFTQVVNGQTVNCNPNLKGFKIFKKASSNVDYYGTYKADSDQTSQLFIQFLTGKCYVYMNIPKETLDVVAEADSIGKAFYKFIKGKFIKGKFKEMEVDDHCIVPVRDSRNINDFVGDDEDDLEFGNDSPLGLDDRELGGSPYGGIGGDDWDD